MRPLKRFLHLRNHLAITKHAPIHLPTSHSTPHKPCHTQLPSIRIPEVRVPITHCPFHSGWYAQRLGSIPRRRGCIQFIISFPRCHCCLLMNSACNCAITKHPPIHFPFKFRVSPYTSKPPFVYRQYVCYYFHTGSRNIWYAQRRGSTARRRLSVSGCIWNRWICPVKYKHPIEG